MEYKKSIQPYSTYSTQALEKSKEIQFSKVEPTCTQ